MKLLRERISRRAAMQRAALAGGALCLPSMLTGCKTPPPPGPKIFRAGACAIDITPPKFPISVNGMMQDRVATQAFDPLHARCLVLDDGRVRMAIVICDSLLLPTELVEEAKRLAAERTLIPATQMLIAATHTHAAPSVAPIFQSEPDVEYSRFLVGQIVAGIAEAEQNLAPAQIGWGVTRDVTQTFCRLWVTRKLSPNPFSQDADRILMHPGYQNPNVIEPAGPADPALTLLAVQTPQGRPIALLANYTMHYAEDQPFVSADYFGYFARKMAGLVGADSKEPPFVTMMSNGAEGDAHCFDYSKPKQARTRESVAESLARATFAAWKRIEYHNWVSLGIRSRSINLEVRRPDEAEVVAARRILGAAAGRPLKGWTEIYARETMLLDTYPREVPLKVQAVRIGGLGIVALPVEAYAITGLVIKRQSPLRQTCVIGLANGYNGYMPPPEHHLLGGYSTWRARSSYLPVDAAPKVVSLATRLLRELTENALRPNEPLPNSPYFRVVQESEPMAYWPLQELCGPSAHDVTEDGNHGSFESKILFSLEGPGIAGFPGFAGRARAPYFFQQRMKARVPGLRRTYSVELWMCNRRPFDDQALASYVFSRGGAGGMGDNFGISGSRGSPTRLFFLNGSARTGLLTGKTELAEGQWYYVTLVRDGETVRGFLNGNLEFAANAVEPVTQEGSLIYIGGHSDNASNFEGKICHVALFARAMSADEIAARFAVATKPRPA